MEVCSLSRGVMLLCGSTPIRSITERRWLAPSSSASHSISAPCGLLSPEGERLVYHVPYTYQLGLDSACSPVTEISAAGEVGTPTLGHVPFGSSLISIFGLLVLTTFISGSLELVIPCAPSSRPQGCWQSPLLLTIWWPSRKMRLHCATGFALLDHSSSTPQ